MMARLTTLPDELRGGAWPSSARAVRCPVNPWMGVTFKPVGGSIFMEIVEYFIGFLLGDGYLYHYKKEGKYLVRVADSSKEFLEMLRTEMLSAGYRGHIYKIKGRNAYVLEFSNKKLYYLCLELATNLLKNPTAPFVAGLIDAEGSLQKPRRGSLRLVVTNTNLTLLHAVSNYLRQIGIEATPKPYGKTRRGERQRYRIIVYGKEKITRIISAIPLRHPKFYPPPRGRKSGNERDPHP